MGEGSLFRIAFCREMAADQIYQSTHHEPFSLRLNLKGAECAKNIQTNPTRTLCLSLVFLTNKQIRLLVNTEYSHPPIFSQKKAA